MKFRASIAHTPVISVGTLIDRRRMTMECCLNEF